MQGSRDQQRGWSPFLAWEKSLGLGLPPRSALPGPCPSDFSTMCFDDGERSQTGMGRISPNLLYITLIGGHLKFWNDCTDKRKEENTHWVPCCSAQNPSHPFPPQIPSSYPQLCCLLRSPARRRQSLEPFSWARAMKTGCRFHPKPLPKPARGWKLVSNQRQMLCPHHDAWGLLLVLFKG